MEIREVSDPDILGKMREEWSSLLERTETATIYQTWDWIEAWWQVFGKGKKLLLLKVWDGSALVGLGPFYISRHLNMPLRRLAFLGTGPSDYLDILAERGRETEIANAITEYLSASREIDLADLQQLRPDGILRKAKPAGNSARNGASTTTHIDQEPCPFVRLPTTWEEFAKILGKKMRSNIAYSERLLERTFSKVESRVVGKKDLDINLTATFDLHQKRWKSRMLPGVMGSGRIQAFHRIAAARFLDNGWLRLHSLKLDDRIVATLYCFSFRKRYYYYLGGFDPALSKYSLGTVLTAHAIRNAIDEDCQEFDFLRGAEPYKYRWQPEERTNSRLLIYKPASARSRIMVKLVDIERTIEHRLKVFAESRGRRKP